MASDRRRSTKHAGTNSKQTIALVVAAIASIGLAALAFAPERFSMGVLTALALSLWFIIVLAVGVLAFEQRKRRERRVLWVLVSRAVLWCTLLLLTYRTRPEHILIPLTGAALMGFLFGMNRYFSWRRHLKDGVIVWEEKASVFAKMKIEIAFLIGFLVVACLLEILFPGHETMLFCLILINGAVAVYYLYLTFAILLMERKTGQKIRYVY